MRIAIISDIHANLPALEEVLKAINKQKPDVIYCAGDVVNQNLWNNEVVELLQNQKIKVVQGNHDKGIALGQKNFPFSYTFPDARKWGLEAIEYTLQQMTEKNRAVLAAYPPIQRLIYKAKNGGSLKLLLTHGSPKDVNERLYFFTAKSYFSSLLNDADTDVLLTGNTHQPHHIIIPCEINGVTIYKHAINPGSVGKPKDGDWRSSYAIITLPANKALHTNADALQVDFYRLKYDLGKVVKAIKKSKLPIYYGGCLISG